MSQVMFKHIFVADNQIVAVAPLS